MKDRSQNSSQTRQQRPGPVTFRTDDIYMSPLARGEMLAALRRALESVVFEVQYLSDEDASNVVADRGALSNGYNRRRVIDALEAGHRLARMYDELAPTEAHIRTVPGDEPDGA